LGLAHLRLLALERAQPAVGASNPASTRTVVVLPAPFGPSSANSVLSGTTSETSSTTEPSR
jgi:hypothetical protein